MLREGALRCFESAIEEDPQNARAEHNRAQMLERLGRTEEAAASHRRMEAMEQLDHSQTTHAVSKHTVLRNRAIGRMLLGQHEQAVEDLKHSLEIRRDAETSRQLEDAQAEVDNPKGAEVFHKALLLLGEEKWAESCEMFREAIHQGDHRHSRCLNGIGLCLTQQATESKGVEEALASFEMALDADPANARAMHNKARALGRLGREEEAAVAQQKVRKQPPCRSLAAHLSEMCCRLQAKELDTKQALVGMGYMAGKTLDSWVSDSAGHDTVGDDGAHTPRAPLPVAPGAFDDAVQLFNEQNWTEARGRFLAAIKAGDPRLGRCYNGIGLCISLEAQFSEDLEVALRNFQMAVDAEPDNARAHHNLSQTLGRLGREEEAEAALSRAQEIEQRGARGGAPQRVDESMVAEDL